MNPGEDLLGLAADGVAKARKLGADQAEVYATSTRSAGVDFQQGDIRNARSEEETALGIRVLRQGSLAFATINDPARLEEACKKALAIARVKPRDPLNGLAEPRPVAALGEKPDPAMAALEMGDVADLAAALLANVRSRDPRVRVHGGGLLAAQVCRAIATSTGIALREEQAFAAGSLLGRAVEGDDVGSFDCDDHCVRRFQELEGELTAMAQRFVAKTTAALGARKGESFRGTVVLAPPVVRDFLAANLLEAQSAKALRTGKSPLKGKLNEQVASPLVSLVDEPRRPFGAASVAFDREGSPTARQPLIEQGILKSFLYDVREGRAEGRLSSGHAQGDASSPPSIGPTNLLLPPGRESLARLLTAQKRAVLVSRFSGSTNLVTGEFSGVVRGGFLIKEGERQPLRETLISGNLWKLLLSVSGISREICNLGGRDLMPALRVEDISVTAG